MIQEPLPLTFKLHDWPTESVKAKLDAMKAMRDQRIESGLIEATPEVAQSDTFVPLSQPLGLLEDLPFQVTRTHTGNLPVYTDTRAGGQRKVTVVRKLFGDVEAFKQELSKIVSNAPIEDKVGRLEISGFHSKKVKLWLTRLGF